ncbi:MAG TPA: SCP2 sterol-binding domain-containing protein [Steroidobacter sp.]|jgi:ubiquinone biosynthesis protein UbiJ|nr:SCP2 sterol-binding domain-containing protein [Steroidobacter sp.]
MRLTPLESALNRNIAASSAARALCKRLEGKVLALHVEGAPISLYFKAHGDHMTLDTSHEGAPNATLSGAPMSLLRLAGPTPEAVLRTRSVHIEGDAEAAQAFSALLSAARPDFEEELSRAVGDVAAHQIGNVARSALQFARRAADVFAQNVAEYLQEEGRDLPSRTEAEEFVAGVDALREAVERLEARLNLLERRKQAASLQNRAPYDHQS